MDLRPRIIVASPEPDEIALVAEWLLAEAFEPVPVVSLAAAIEEAESRPYDVLIADAAYAFEGRLHAVSRTCNPRAPVIVVGGRDAGVLADRCGAFHLERPLDHALLLCHVTMAILEGRPARRSERKRTPRFDAVVDGAQGFVIDVSNEGLRFEFSRGRFAPAPQFTVRVPLIGIALTVRRVWVSAAPGASTAAWCGVELHEAHPRAETNWRNFVNTVPTA